MGLQLISSGHWLHRDVISIGVMSGNNNVLKLEHLYHFVGDKDLVERVGSILFPKRWKSSFVLLDRAKRRGKISISSLGPVGHNDVGGPSEQQILPMVAAICQTVDLVANSHLLKQLLKAKLATTNLSNSCV